MNVPAIAQKTFESLKNKNEFLSIVHHVLSQLKRLTDPKARTLWLHRLIDKYNQEVFSHPLVKEFSPCGKGCSACCHTQVSVTEDEAEILAMRIKEGVHIEYKNLQTQLQTKNSSQDFYKLDFQKRRCIFLDDNGACKIYDDRPSVCRTNAVLGEKEQCDTSRSVQPVRLIRTPKSDMVIYASFLYSKNSGALAYMVGKKLGMTKDSGQLAAMQVLRPLD